MTDAMNRIMTTPLAVDARGSSVRVVVAADKYTVANVSNGMNDREEYARLFAAAPELLDFARNVAGLDDGALTRADLNYFRSLIREWRDDARSIITKVTGGAS